nr:MAG TPA: hypothetical protein [Caudoviricetes sp.]
MKLWFYERFYCATLHEFWIVGGIPLFLIDGGAICYHFILHMNFIPKYKQITKRR